MPTSTISDLLAKVTEDLFTEGEPRDNALKVITSPEFGYYYGPYIVLAHEKGLSKDEYNEFYNRNEVIRYLAAINEIKDTVKSPSTSRDLKSKIVHFMHNEDKGFNKDYRALGMTMLHNIRDYTYKNKLLESAMTGYAPIVPYEGVTSKSPDISPNAVTLPKCNDNEKSPFTVINYIVSIIENNSNGSFLPYLKKILTTYPFQVLEGATLQIPISPDIKTIPAYSLDQVLIPDPSLYQAFPHMIHVYAYYFLSAASYAKWDIAKTVAFLKEYVEKCNITQNGDAMEALNYMLNQENSLKFEHVMEEWGIDETYMEKQLEEIARHDPSDIEETFDLSQLANHIYRSRKYQISEYINSLFLSKNPELEVHSFYRNGMLIAQLDQRYIITPVTDIADDYKAKMIMMDTDNEIIIEDGLRVHRATDSEGNVVDQITSDTENQ